MGRNGKNPAVFVKVKEFVNSHAGKTVTSSEILLGKEPGMNPETGYLYKMLKLGYIEAVNNGFVMDKSTMYRIVKPFPDYYNSVLFTNELKAAKGLVPESIKTY